MAHDFLSNAELIQQLFLSARCQAVPSLIGDTSNDGEAGCISRSHECDGARNAWSQMIELILSRAIFTLMVEGL